MDLIKLNGLNPSFKERVLLMMKTFVDHQLSIDIFSGFRSAEEQQKLYDLGRTVINPDGACEQKPMGNVVTNSKPFESWHNFGLAVDFCYRDVNGNWNWNVSDYNWQIIGDIAIKTGLEWGGNWIGFKDKPHVQLRGRYNSVKDAKSFYDLGGLDLVWSKLLND